VLHKTLPTDEPYGESWELHDSAIISNGGLKGRSLGDVLQEYGQAIVGLGNDPTKGFPLLAKFLDAQDWLSVQVHPNDDQAAQLEGEPRGKTEAWVILESAPDAELVIGLTPNTSRQTITDAIQSSTLEDYLVKARVSAGDVLFIPAGTVHAIGPGTLIYEIQQSSDTTYRLYDWGRMGLDGQPRPLHIEKGVQVSHVESLPTIESYGTQTEALLVTSDYFQTYRHRLHGNSLPLKTEGRFHALTCIDGEIIVSSQAESVTFRVGQTVLIPAGLPEYTLSGTGVILRSWQGDSSHD
jgi:mannose-6-phosphate isomerase